MEQKLTMKKGITDALPIFLGYFSVSIAFGVLAVKKGIPLWAPLVMSLTDFSGTGQFAALDLLSSLAAFAEIACAILIINARYFLMSVSLSQKLPPDIKQWQRYIIAFGNTDEVYAVAMGQTLPLNFKYILGLILCSYCGWVGGTVAGTFGGSMVPAAVSSAFGISLYAMFLAIIIPPATQSKPITVTILLAGFISCIFYYTPGLKNLSSGWIIIISGIAASAFSALKFPVTEDKNEL